MAEQNHLGDKKVTVLPGVIPSLSNDAEFFPGPAEVLVAARSWSTTRRRRRGGRPARSDGPAWPTCSTGSTGRTAIGGFWATQILPFGDPVSFGGYMDFETAFYACLRQTKAA